MFSQDDPAGAQRPIVDLEQEYQAAEAAHEAALGLLAVRQRAFNEALSELSAADAAGDQDQKEAAFTEIHRLNPILQEQEARVAQTAQTLREARASLLSGRLLELEGLLARTDSITTRDDSLALAVEIQDNRYRIQDLRLAADPPETLEAGSDITIEGRDTPDQIRGKAAFLDRRADQAELLLAEYGRQLADLQHELGLEQRSRDFLDGVARFDAATLPVAAAEVRPGQAAGAGQPPVADTVEGQAVPLTVEERIQSLVFLQGQLEERIQQLRAKAQNFRRQAGGEWAQ